VDAKQQDATYQEVLQAAGVHSLEELRSLDSAALQRASGAVIFNASYGSFSFWPVVDHSFVPDVPGILLREGKFHKKIKKVMVGHNADEVRISPLLFSPLFCPEYQRLPPHPAR
jgi:carboxylesterase type B